MQKLEVNTRRTRQAKYTVPLHVRVTPELYERVRKYVRDGKLCHFNVVARHALERFFKDFPDPGLQLAEELLRPPQRRRELVPEHLQNPEERLPT